MLINLFMELSKTTAATSFHLDKNKSQQTTNTDIGCLVDVLFLSPPDDQDTPRAPLSPFGAGLTWDIRHPPIHHHERNRHRQD